MKLPEAACAECPGRDAKCVPPEYAAVPLRDGVRRLAIVGEGPGHNELNEGRPFVGQSGRLLMRMLEHGGERLSRADVHWTNAVPCAVREVELPKARACCAKRLAVELEAAGVEVVVPVGKHALAAIVGGSPKIQKWRGSVIRLGPDGDPSGRKGRPVGTLCLPTVHPAFALRSPEWEPVLELDIARAKRIAAHGYVTLESQARPFVIARDVADIAAFGAVVGRTVAIDVETDGEEPMVANMTCFGMSDGEHTIVVPWPMAGAAEATNAVLASRVALTHNGPAFDHVVLGQHGIRVVAWDDSMTKQHVIAGHLPKRLQHVVTLHLDVPPWKDEHANDPTTLLLYNGRDVLYTKRAWDQMRVPEALAPLYESDKRVAVLCREMQLNGFAFDSERAKRFETTLRSRERVLATEAEALLGKVSKRDPDKPINLLSHKQVANAFTETLGVPVLFRRKKTRAPMFDVDALRAYAAGGDWDNGDVVSAFALLLIKYRNLRKMRGTYVCGDGARPLSDGRVHVQWSMRTISGRLTSDLMTLPRKENDPLAGDGGIRSLYTCAPGTVLVAFDAKQLEMRVAAYVSGDDAMIAACESTDLHAANAEAIFGAAFLTATPEERKALRNLSKSAGFAVCYMAEAATVYARIIASGTQVTLRQVEAMLRKLRTAFARYFAFCDENMSVVIRRGYVEAPLSGRRRYVGHAPEPTKVANFPIQAGAGDLLNDRLPRITDAVRPMGARLVAQVHDAGYFEVPRGRENDVIATGDAIFREPVRFANGREAVFPLDWHVGERWNEL